MQRMMGYITWLGSIVYTFHNALCNPQLTFWQRYKLLYTLASALSGEQEVISVTLQQFFVEQFNRVGSYSWFYPCLLQSHLPPTRRAAAPPTPPSTADSRGAGGDQLSHSCPHVFPQTIKTDWIWACGRGWVWRQLLYLYTGTFKD